MRSNSGAQRAAASDAKRRLRLVRWSASLAISALPVHARNWPCERGRCALTRRSAAAERAARSSPLQRLVRRRAPDIHDLRSSGPFILALLQCFAFIALGSIGRLCDCFFYPGPSRGSLLLTICRGPHSFDRGLP